MLTFDRKTVEPGYALRCTVGVALPLIAGLLLHQPAFGGAAAIGAFITGFTSQQGVYRTRLAAILGAAAGMAVTSFVGGLAAHSTLALVIVTAVIGYLYGAVAQLGPAATTAGINSFVAFVIFSAQPLAPLEDLRQSLFVFAGGVVQAILLLLIWPTVHFGVERTALADVYRRLAEYARSVAQGTQSLPPVTPFGTARQILADPQPFARAAEIARFARALEDAESIRTRLGALGAIALQEGTDQTLREFVDAVSVQLAKLAEIFEGRSDDEQLQPMRDATRAAFDRFESASGSQKLRVATAQELATQLLDATQAATVISSGTVPGFHLSSVPRPGPYVDVRVEWFNRDSLRFALILAVATIVARNFTADRGYWIPLTAALVLKPDFQTTFVRGTARIGGTLVGAVVAVLAISATHGNVVWQTAGVLVAATVAYLTLIPNYAVFTVAITSFVVMILAIRGLPGTTTITERVLDTLVGGALAMLGYLALPTWEHKRTRALLADYIDVNNRLAQAILAGYLTRSGDTSDAVARERTAAWKLRTAVEASIDRTRREPNLPHTIGPGRALRILAATQLFAQANLALETPLEALESTTPWPQLAAFTQGLDTMMGELADALRTSRRTRAGNALASEMARLDGQLDAATPYELRFIVEHLRGYVEATTRLSRLIGTTRT